MVAIPALQENPGAAIVLFQIFVSTKISNWKTLVTEVLNSVATGISYGAIADDEHAKVAVQRAMAKLPNTRVASVLLFLTSTFAHNPQNAIKLAAIAAGTTQVLGCCATGLISEEDWLLDGEGAVAMIFSNDFAMTPQSLVPHSDQANATFLCLTSPNAAQMAIHSLDTGRTIGALSSDEYGHGPFSIWQSGKISEQEIYS